MGADGLSCPTQNMKNPTVRDISKKCGISPSGVSAALRNRPNISPETKALVLRAAAELGYQTDARLNQLMAYLRSGKAAASAPNVAWLHQCEGVDDFITMPWIAGYLVGAQRRAAQFGYHLDIIWGKAPDIPLKRIPSVLKARGIEGIITYEPTDIFPWNIPLDWSQFALSALEGDYSATKLPRVITHGFKRMRQMMAKLVEYGYRRPGLVIGSWINETNDYYWRGGFVDSQDLLEPCNRIQPLIMDGWEDSLPGWLKQNNPDVIVCVEDRMLDVLGRKGYRVPNDVALVHLNIYSNVADWCGIDNLHEQLGEAAFDMMMAQINRWETGLVTNPKTIFLQGLWQDGWTCPPRPAV